MVSCEFFQIFEMTYVCGTISLTKMLSRTAAQHSHRIPFLSRHNLLGKQSIGGISEPFATKHRFFTKAAARPADAQLKSAEFKIIYRFPYIRAARLITRLKLYQTGITVIAIPPACYAYLTDIINLNACAAAMSIASFALMMLVIMSNLLQRVLGLVAVNDDLQYARFSHLNFWGRRRDVYVPFEDIMTLSDVSENKDDIFVKIRRFSNKDFFYLSLRLGRIDDLEKLQLLIGSVSSNQ